jgi:uroporphyrinogen III methyltransferase / synthase
MKRILITRPESQADAFAAALTAAGFEPVFFPVIEIRPMEDTSALDQALHNLASYDWVVFTSVNGVEVFWNRLADVAISHLPRDLRVAAIGPKTAEALMGRGVSPDYVPEEYVAEAILPGLGELKGRRVLLPRAEIARKALPEAILRAGGFVHEIAVYQTLPAQPNTRGLDALRSGVDVITFTSPSTVHNFMSIARKAGLNPLNLPGSPRLACIGPITAGAASQEGLVVDLVAEEYTTEGLVNLLMDKVNR